MKGEPQTRIESHEVRQNNYHNFQPGSLFATCKRTSAYEQIAERFMPHHRLQMDSFHSESQAPPVSSYQVIDTPTYLLARDEDCENLFHSSSDHVSDFMLKVKDAEEKHSISFTLFHFVLQMNMYLAVEHILKMSFQDLAVVLFDR